MFKEQYEKLVAKFGKKNVTIGAVVIGIILIGWIGNSASRRSGNEAAERIIEAATGGQVDVDADGNTVTVKTDQGTFTTTDKLPADFPSDVPVYAGAKVSGSVAGAGGENEGFYVGLETSAPAADVIAWYRNEVKAKGWTIVTDASVSGGLYLGASKDTRMLSVAVSQEDGVTAISLGVAKQ